MSAVRALADGDRGQKFEFGFGFDVDAEDAVLDREVEFTGGLADAREHNPLRRNAGGAGAVKFAFRHDIGAGTEPSERGDDRLVGVRFERVTNKRVDIGEGGGEDIVVPLDRGAGIAIERRADDVGKLSEIDRFGMQHAVAIGEMMHGTCLVHESENWTMLACSVTLGRERSEQSEWVPGRPFARHPA